MSDQTSNPTTPETAAETTPLKLDVNVRPIEPKNNLLAFASVKIADCFVVNGIKVVAGEKGLFVDMPSVPDKNKEGKFHDVCFPVTSDFRQQLNSAVLDGYSAAIDKMQEVGAAQREFAKQRPSMQDQLRDGAEAAAKHNAAIPKAPDAPKRTEASI